MPVFNNIFLETTPDGKQKLSKSILLKAGPVVPIEVSLPTSLVDVFTRQQKPIPAPETGLVLIDTGATRSCVDDDVIRKLGVYPIRQGEINNTTGKQKVNIYPAHFKFPSMANFQIEFTSAIGVNIKAQKVNGRPIIALIGRDVLSTCILIYNGPMGTFTLTF